MKIRRWARVSLGLGALSMLALLASHLALTDIYHGEGDLSLEWTVVRISLGVVLAFQLVALATLGKVSSGPQDRREELNQVA